MEAVQNITLIFTIAASTVDPHSSSTLSVSPSNLSTTLSPAIHPFLGLHPPLPAIIVSACLFVLFGSCVIYMATCRSSRTSGGYGDDGVCGSGDGHYCGRTLSSEPQLKLWKRLGSVRRSFSSAPSFRRPQRRQESKLALQLAQDRSDLQAQLTIPCLLQYATEI